MELTGIIALLEQYRYLILFPLACIEGPIVGFISGTLVPLGYFNVVVLLIVLVCADVIPDLVYYFLGRWGKKKTLVARIGPKLRITKEHFGVIKELWHTRPFITMVVTKFAYGLSTPLLISAGLVHLPFSIFWRYSILIAVGQYTALVTLGYFFGSYFALVQDTMLRVQMIVAAAAVVFGVYFFITRQVRSTFLANEKKGEKIDI